MRLPIPLAPAAAAALWLLIPDTAVAQPVLLVGQGDPAPGGGVFESSSDIAFEPPVFDGTWLAFRGARQGGPGPGLFRLDLAGGGLEIVDGDSAQPGTGGTFDDFSAPSIDDGEIAFIGVNEEEIGVYWSDGVGVERVADTSSDFPDATAAILGFDRPSIDGRIAVTATNAAAAFSGVYSTGPWLGLRTIADSNYTPPAGAGFFNLQQGTIGGGRYAFLQNDSPTGNQQIWISDAQPSPLPQPIEVLVRSTDPMPGVPGAAFDTFLYPQLDRAHGGLCFRASGTVGNVKGIYRWDDDLDEIELIADTNTPIPDGEGDFAEFGLHCAIHEGDVAFEGSGSAFGTQGVFWKPRGGTVRKVLASGDAFEGGTVFHVGVSREAIVDQQIALHVRWSSGLEGLDGIAVTGLPEPGTAAAAVAFAALAALQRTRRGGGSRTGRSA